MKKNGMNRGQLSLITSKKIPTLIKIEFSKKNKDYSWIIDPNITYALQN